MDLGVFELVRQCQRDIHSYTSNVPQISPGLEVNLSLPRKLDEEVVNMGLVLPLNALAIKTPNVTTTCSSERAAFLLDSRRMDMRPKLIEYCFTVIEQFKPSLR